MIAQTQGGGLCTGGRRVGGAGKLGNRTPLWYGFAPCKETEVDVFSFGHDYYILIMYVRILGSGYSILG